jgi:hypothetical protein
VGEWAAVVSAIGSIGTLVVAVVTMRHVQSVKVEINSRMSELLKSRTKAAHAAGMEQERLRPGTPPEVESGG